MLRNYRETLMVVPSRLLEGRFDRELDIDVCTVGDALHGRGYTLIIIAADLAKYEKGQEWFDHAVHTCLRPNGQIIRLDANKQAEGAR